MDIDAYQIEGSPVDRYLLEDGSGVYMLESQSEKIPYVNYARTDAI